MIIKKKDGNVYVIKGPNKLAEKQKDWDSSKLVFHNFTWEEIHYKNLKNKSKIELSKNEKPTAVEEIIEKPIAVEEIIEKPIAVEEIIEKPIAVEEIIEKPIAVEKIQIPEIETTKKEELEVVEVNFPKIKYKVLMHCLPAIKNNYKDDFYGDSWYKITYGKKFIFPCIITESLDLNLEFWTSDPNEQIKENSIIFPFCYEVYNENNQSYDRVPYDEHRWWKIINKETKTGGWLMKAIPSQENPDFSD